MSLILMDAFPAVPGTDTVPSRRTTADGTARLAERIRAELGALLGGVDEEEIASLAQVFDNNATLRIRHNYGTFGGETLILVAEEGKRADFSAETLWQPHLTRQASTVPLPCAHSDMARPDMLARAWEAIAEWLHTRS